MNGAVYGYRRVTRLPHAEHIVYQGLEGAYSNLAAVQVFRDYPEASFSHVKSFDAAVRAVDEGTGDYAVLPIENSTAGSVADSYDALAKREVLKNISPPSLSSKYGRYAPPKLGSSLTIAAICPLAFEILTASPALTPSREAICGARYSAPASPNPLLAPLNLLN